MRPFYLTHGLLVAVLIFTAVGCASVPFEEPARTPLSETDPGRMLDGFRQRLPARHNLLNALTFRIGWYDPVSALGYIAVEPESGRIHAVCINQLGVKIFDITADPNGVTNHFGLTDRLRSRFFTKALGSDFRRIWFDRVPEGRVETVTDRYAMEFRSERNGGILIHVFGGPDAALLEKRFEIEGDMRWRVKYYDYRMEAGALHPGGIVLDNWDAGYRMILRLKEVSEP